MTGETGAGSRLDPTEAFGLLGNETRLAVVRELAARRRTNWRREGLGFADLRRAVGVRDAGTFSYHLDALAGHLVEQRGDEYVLTSAGLAVADAVVAGTYGDPGERRKAGTSYRCPECDDALVGRYENGRVSVACEAHGIQFATALPPGAVADRSMAEVLEIAARDARQEMERAAAGVCFHCWGRMASSLQVEAPFEGPATGEPLDGAPDGPGEWSALAVFECGRCETAFWMGPPAAVVRHPALVSFAHECGVDLQTSLPVEGAAWTVEDVVESREPFRLRLAFRAGGDELELVLDPDADVVAVRE